MKTTLLDLWERLIRWIASDHIAYLEYENRELRYENEAWRHRYEGAIAAVRVFEARSNHIWQNILDSESLKMPTAKMMLDKPEERAK